MTKRYSLTAEQKTKIEPLLLEQQKQIHTLGEDESLTDAEWTAAVRKAHQATVLKVRKLLSDAQLSKYAKDEVKRAKQRGTTRTRTTMGLRMGLHRMAGLRRAGAGRVAVGRGAGAGWIQA